MTRCRAIATAIIASACALGPAAGAQAGDRSRPPTPSNFRVTAKTPFSVTLAWDTPRSSSGDFTYRLSSTARGPAVTLPKTATSYTWSAGVVPGNTYWFFLYAVNAAGNAAGQANISATVPRDTTAPSAAPVVSVAEVGSNYVALAWTAAQDDGPYLFYEVWQDGSLYARVGTERSATVRFLGPATTHTFRVRAYDYGSNLSPFSDVVTVTGLLPKN
jgi:hypothetical protein